MMDNGLNELLNKARADGHTEVLAAHEQAVQETALNAALAPALAYLLGADDADLNAAITALERELPAMRRRHLADTLTGDAPRDRDLINILNFLRKQAIRQPRTIRGIVPDRCPEGTSWLVEGWLPVGRVGLLTGTGGAGKSRLALQLCLGLAAARGDWLPSFDLIPTEEPVLPILPDANPVRCVIASWEDDPETIMRRAYRMGRKWDTYAQEETVGPLPWVTQKVGNRIACVDLAGCGPLWGPTEEGSRHVSTVGELTEAGRRVRREAQDWGAGLLVIDPLAAAYGGDENVRPLVRAFMADWEAWARDTGCAVLIIAHPPKGGASGYSGSTDWQAAARFLWILESVEGTDPPRMELRLEKSNYAIAGESVHLLQTFPAWKQTTWMVRETKEKDQPASQGTEESKTSFPHDAI